MSELPINTIICGDNCDVMGTFPRDCIDLVVTSPPYDDLRKYHGHGWDFYGVAWQLKRVLKPGGVIVWVVSDATVDGSETGTSMRQALHFKDLGLNLHDTMIYRKDGMSTPNVHHPRYHHCWEYMFVFCKNGVDTFNEYKKRPNSTYGQQRKTLSRSRRRDGKLVAYGRPYVTPKESREFNIWTYLTGFPSSDDPFAKLHPAVFPEKLATDHIMSWSNEGDIVLDPFNGSGTTTKVARKLGRKYIGIDVSEEYCEIARQRMAQQLLPFGKL